MIKGKVFKWCKVWVRGAYTELITENSTKPKKIQKANILRESKAYKIKSFYFSVFFNGIYYVIVISSNLCIRKYDLLILNYLILTAAETIGEDLKN